MMTKKVAWFVFFALVTASCLDNPDCFHLNNNMVGISFGKMFDGKSDTVALVSIKAEGTDSVFRQYILTNGVSLPLNYLSDQTTFYFEQPDGTTRSLVLGYSAKPQFVSEDCGERFVLSSLNILDHDFDSVRLVNDTPYPASGTNVILYRCPITNVVKFTFRQLYTDTVSNGTPVALTINNITDDYSGATFYSDTVLNAVRLPLNPASTSTQYQFSLADGDSSITLNYRATTRTIFDQCGPQQLYDSLSIASSEFPLTKVVHDSIEDPAITNVLLLRCPQTNLVKILFKAQTTTGSSQSVSIKKITTDYSTDVFYEETKANNIVLPLNLDATTTTFTIEFDDGTIKNLALQYVLSEPYHQGCDGKLVSSLSVVSSGFTTTPEVLNTDVKFPTINNIAVVND